MELVVTVRSGCGKAHVVQTRPGMRRGMEYLATIAGWKAIPGTLNVDLEPGVELAWKDPVRAILRAPAGECPVLICRYRGHRRGKLLELLAPVHLRETLGLADGDQVRLEIPAELRVFTAPG